MGTISEILYPSPLSRLLIAADEDAISRIHFLDDNEEVPASVGEDTNHPLLQECKNQLSAFFEGNLTAFSVPVRQEGTVFQQKVWAELLKIPYGKTISYLELSKRIGDVKAIRAVGTSNGKNEIAIIVPCHRVIGTNGTLTGYAGGLWRKQWLLEHEMKVMHGVQTLF